MKIIFSISFILLALTRLCNADPITIQSGDHQHFSRIVLKLEKGTTWTAQQLKHAVVVTISGHHDGFDSSKVFRKISKKRIKSIKSYKNSIHLIYSCKCEVSAFEVNEKYLAIDISDNGFSIMKPMKIAPESKENTLNTYNKSHIPLLSKGNQKSFPKLINSTSARLKINPPFTKKITNKIGTASNDTNHISNIISRKISTFLSTGALYSGFKNYKYDITANPPLNNIYQTNINTKLISNNVSITSSGRIDRMLSPRDSSKDDHTCPILIKSSMEVNTENYFQKELSKLRKSLFDDFDQVNHSIVQKLINHYLSFGLGTEAKALINRYQTGKPGYLISLRIARLIEHGESQDEASDFISGECDGYGDIWNILLDPSNKSYSKLNINSALISLNKMPVQLREVLAPILSKRLNSAKEHKAAISALQTISRVNRYIGDHAKLALYETNKIDKKNSSTAKILTDALRKNTDASPSALIELVKNEIQNGENIQDRTFTLMDAFVKESAEPKNLFETQTLAMIKSGQFDKAFRKLDNPLITTNSRKYLEREFFSQLTRSADDIKFLEYILYLKSNDFRRKFPETSEKAAERLKLLGFTSRANDLISISDFSPTRNVRSKYTVHAFDNELEMNSENRHKETAISATDSQSGLINSSYQALSKSKKMRTGLRKTLFGKED